MSVFRIDETGYNAQGTPLDHGETPRGPCQQNGPAMPKEHRKNARPSTREKHQKGRRRKKKDAGGEKGDARRTPRK
jgi:hypothetical protein